jgi:hypothetical protein
MASPSSTSSEALVSHQGRWDTRSIDNGEPIVLEVGNFVFKTTISTLKKIPNSYFSALLSGQYPIVRQSDGSIFIDRDGKHFSSILSFMRSGFLAKPKDRIEKKELLLEAEYYCIQEAILEAWVRQPNDFRLGGELSRAFFGLTWGIAANLVFNFDRLTMKKTNREEMRTAVFGKAT